MRRQVEALAWLTAGFLLLMASMLWFAMPVHAQRSATVTTCGTFTGAAPAVGSAGIVALDQNGNTCVAGSISTSIAGFAPAGTFATLTATGSSASVALPAGTVVIFQNTGTTAVSCTLGVGSATALVSENIIQSGSWAAYTVGSNTFGACIDQSGSTSNVVVLSGGTGIPTGAGGGSASAAASTTPVIGASVLATGTGWTSATAGDATQTLMSTYGAPALLVQLVQGSTISAGAVTFEGTYDAVPNWVAIPDAQLLNPNTLANAGTTSGVYTLVASTNKPFLILTQGYQQIRIRLSTAITGSATVTPYTANLNYNPALGALLNPLAAGSAIIGNVRIDQTTPSTTNGVAITQTTDGTTNFTRSSPRIATVTTGITRPADTAAYAANDNFANSTSAPTTGGFTFTSACAASGGNGLIKSAVVSASAATSYQGEVWIFDQAVTAVNDNAAFTVSDSDILNLVGIIPFTTSDITAANSVSYITGLDIGYTCSGTANLRYLVKIMAAVTPASAEVLTVRLQVQN